MKPSPETTKNSPGISDLELAREQFLLERSIWLGAKAASSWLEADDAMDRLDEILDRTHELLVIENDGKRYEQRTAA